MKTINAASILYTSLFILLIGNQNLNASQIKCEPTSTKVEQISANLPPTNLKVDSLSLRASWEAPVYFVLNQDFEGAAFPPANWTNQTQGSGWFLTTNGSSQYFSIPAHTKYACINDDGNNQNECCSYLSTPELDLTPYEGFVLEFDSYFRSSWGETASVKYSVDNGNTWRLLQPVEISSGWITQSIDLSSLSGINGENFVQIGFHFNDNGEWAGGWAIDNVKIRKKISPDLGYNIYLNGEYQGNTHDTSFFINPDNINFCEEYTAEVEAQYATGFSDRISKHFTSSFLYPPSNFDAYFNDWIILEWDSPENGKKSSNLMQADLIGYKLYRNNMLIAELDTNQHWFVDPLIWPDNFLYSIVAKYNVPLTECADNQGFAYSIKSYAEVSISGWPLLPFNEDWTTGQFDINQWSVDQNWIIDGAVGNNAPSAKFKSEPILTDYKNSLTSFYFNSNYIQTETPYSLYFDFDIKLDDSIMNGLEKMDVDILLESDTIPLYSFQNTGDFNWTHLHLDISDIAKDTVFRIRFTANGQNTANINGWWIDNIHIYLDYYLYPPLNLTAKRTGNPENDMLLTWQKPVLGAVIPGEWKQYGSETNSGSYSPGGATDFSVAIKYSPGDLANLNGKAVKKIKFFPKEPNCDYSVRIWNDSGTLVNQAVTNLTMNSWNEIAINEPLVIDTSENLYIGYHCVPQNGNPAGYDPGPAVAGKGDLISLDGGRTWHSLSTEYSIDANWNIAAFIEGFADSATNINNYTIYRKDYESHPANIDPEMNDSLLYSYLGYVNGDTFSYLDTDLPNTDINCYSYFVKASYHEGLSLHSNYSWDCIYVSNDPVEENTLKIYPNPASSVIYVESADGIKEILVYNALGVMMEKILMNGEKKTTFDVENRTPGIYHLIITTNKAEILERRLIIN